MQSTRPSSGNPAERSATLALSLALLSVGVALLALWLLNFFGQMALGIGFLTWLVTWLASIVFGVAALRGAPRAADPGKVRRKVIVGLVVDGITGAMICMFFIGLAVAIQQLT
jgi:hypothetical protein